MPSLLYDLFQGKVVQVMAMAIDDIAEDYVECKVSDGRHWVTARFSPDYKLLFETQRLKANKLVKLLKCRPDHDEDYSDILYIVSFGE